MATVELASTMAIAFAIDEPVEEIQMAPQIVFSTLMDLSSPMRTISSMSVLIGMSAALNQSHTLKCEMNIVLQFSQAGAIAREFRSFIQGASLDEYVHLYKIDCTILGGGVFYFTASVDTGGVVKFAGNTYVPVDFESEGWEWNGQNQLPTPKIRIANTTMYLTALLQQYDDLLGAVVTRTRTFKRFLDNGSNANSLASFKTDIFRVERKATENKFFVELELSSAIDQQGRMLPGRQILKDLCTHRYRVWSDILGDFDYTYVTCPYRGTDYFDTNGNIVIAPNDRCGKRLQSCKDRFKEAPLPTRKFPGVARVRA